MEANNNPQAEPQQQAPQQSATPQQPQQAPQPQQKALAPHPLNGIDIPAAFRPYAAVLNNPMATFRGCFKSEKEADITLRRETEFAMQAMYANNFLITCAAKDNGLSIANAIKSVALTGLSLNPALKQAYLVPFKGVVTFMPGYIGMRDMLIKTGLVTNIESHIVYNDEVFEIQYGENAKLVHKPNPFARNHNKNTMLGAYFIATLPTGKQIFDTMNMDEITKVQQASPSSGTGKSSPWDTWYEEMVKKTLIRRGFKAVPHVNLSEENLKVIQATIAADDKCFISDKPARAGKSDFEEIYDEAEEVQA